MKIRLAALGLVLTASLVGAGWAIGGSDSRSGERSEVASVQTKGDASMSAASGTPPHAVGSRRVLGVWLLVMTGTAVGLRAQKARTI